MPDRVLRGRVGEIEALVAALTRAEADGPGSMIFLAGEPGIGKSALLRLVQRRALAREFAVSAAWGIFDRLRAGPALAQVQSMLASEESATAAQEQAGYPVGVP
jgi:replication-associated recombination protein RarA